MSESSITFTPGEVSVYYAASMPDLRQRGKRWRGACRIHRGKHYSFSVDSETGLWRCWSECGRGGDIITLEIALTGAAWRDAVIQIEDIIGRQLLNRPASRAERRALAERREREQRETREAEYFQFAAIRIAEHILEDVLPEAVPGRYAPTQFLLKIRAAKGAALLTLYRDWREREPTLTAALVHAGERTWNRQCDALAGFIADTEVKDAA